MFKVSGLWTGAVGRIAVASVVCFLQAAAAGAGQLIISEFRLRGPSGAEDEFIEIYNNTDVAHTVSGVGTGYGIVASDGVARCVIPNGTILPARGHYLCVNSDSSGYSLAGYPAGNGTTATGDATFTTDIPDNAGVALFNTSVAGGFILANRLDAVGSTSEVNTLYKEGVGYPAITPFSIDYSFVRKVPGGCTGAGGGNCGSALLAADDGRPEHDGLAGHGRQRQRLHPLRGHQRYQCRRRPAAWSARTAEPELADFPRRVCAGGRQARRVRAARRVAKSGPRLHLRPWEQLDVRHPRHPSYLHQQHGRRPHAVAAPDSGHHDVPFPLRSRRPAATHVARHRRVRRSGGLRHGALHRPRSWNDAGNTPFAAQRFRVQRFAVGRLGHPRDTAGGRRLRGRALPARHPADGRRPFLCRPRDASCIELAGVLFPRLD